MTTKPCLWRLVRFSPTMYNTESRQQSEIKKKSRSSRFMRRRRAERLLFVLNFSARAAFFCAQDIFAPFPKSTKQKTNGFDFQENLSSEKQMVLSFPKIYRAKNKCFWLSRKSTEQKTSVFAFQENLSSEKQTFQMRNNILK